MSASQTVLFTVIPAGLSRKPGTLAVSVVVSPRLMGATRLGAFVDWVNWTGKLKAGMKITLRSDARSVTVPVNTAPLDPRLWQALFNEGTPVSSRVFDDYSKHEVVSFSVRDALSTLKSVYQVASVALALPDPADKTDPNAPVDERGKTVAVPPTVTNRMRLAGLLKGLDVHWGKGNVDALRKAARARSRAPLAARGALDSEGLVTRPLDPNAFRETAGDFSAYHHMPTTVTPAVGELTFDPKTIDFHKAIAAVEAHQVLQLALGLVLELDVPEDFVPATGGAKPVNVWVESTDLAWRLAPQSPPLKTACVRMSAGGVSLFQPASRQDTQPGPMEVRGLLKLDPGRFGLAQLDVDGGMFKAIATAENHCSPDPARTDRPSQLDAAPNPEVHDSEATVAALRSAGLQLYLDGRGASTIDAITRSQAFNDVVSKGTPQKDPFYAEDLVRGYRLDIWESRTGAWRSLHARTANYTVGDAQVPVAANEEGFLQLAATQPAPGATNDKDLYVHEVIARWAGWSLSVPFPGLALSKHAKADEAVPGGKPGVDYSTDEALTPFKIHADYKVPRGSLPLLRFGERYRVRARAVDLAGNSLPLGASADALSNDMALPRDPEGLAYLRWEPVPAPLVVIRDQAAVTDPGSALHRIVIRTFNDSPEKDSAPAVLAHSDRHIVPPRTSVELAERMGMFDENGKLKSDAATYDLIAKRDAGDFRKQSFEIAGKLAKDVPVEPGAALNPLPYLPDLYARGAALRDLPGTPAISRGRASPTDPAAGAIAYDPLTDINPRAGSATLIAFNDNGADWQSTWGFRLALAEPPGGSTAAAPHWDPVARVLTVYLPKGSTAVVPLSSFCAPADLKFFGQWQWMRELVDLASIFFAVPQHLLPGQPVDLLAQILQRVVEGGHWMLNPPTLITLVHAVQQPLQAPTFTALNVQRDDWMGARTLQTDRVRSRADAQELGAVTAWRRLGETSSCLLGALRVHGASTAKVNLRARWEDPVDEPVPGVVNDHPTKRAFAAAVDELPLPSVAEGYLAAPGSTSQYDKRRVGYYDPEHDQIAMVREGDRAERASGTQLVFRADAAPRHEFSDTKRHIVTYQAIATSRFQDYFEQGGHPPPVFTREGPEVVVDVPASARPVAPSVRYVVPTFGWQRQTDTNIKRSVRFGGGLRVYLDRPWYSSGAGELIGVTLWSNANGALDDSARDKFKNCFTQWGMDPIWQTADLAAAPSIANFPDAHSFDRGVSLEETSARKSDGTPGQVDVVGFAPEYDPERKLWFADLTVDLADSPARFITSATYAPFVRLALVRYQPHALDDARISRVVLAGFAQLTPDRSAVVTADPHHPRTLRIVVSGPAPRGPAPLGPAAERPVRPTDVRVRVQQRVGKGELDWKDAPAADAQVVQFYEGQAINQPDLGLWVGSVTFTATPKAGDYRLLVEEFEYISATYAEGRRAPGRLIYAEMFQVDAALLGG